jgi:uncharacterized protein YndB with AHSA1/START domain
VIKLVMGAEILAERQSVWTALADPRQVERWRPGIECARTPEASFPTEGRRFKWRCRLNEIPIDLVETPLRVVPTTRLESEIFLGLFRFHQTFTLAAAQDGTRLIIQIETPNRMPLVGGSLDRFAVRRFATDLASTYLQAVRDWCERGESQPLPLLELRLGGAAPAYGL